MHVCIWYYNVKHCLKKLKRRDLMGDLAIGWRMLVVWMWKKYVEGLSETWY